MTQLALAFDAPLQRRPSLPYSGRTAVTRACSREASIAAAAFAPSQEARVLAWWESRGMRGGTDPECEAGTRVGRPSICQRRNTLMATGQLIALGELVRAGRLPADTETTRVHHTGRRCAVFVAASVLRREGIL